MVPARVQFVQAAKVVECEGVLPQHPHDLPEEEDHPRQGTRGSHQRDIRERVERVAKGLKLKVER